MAKELGIKPRSLIKNIPAKGPSQPSGSSPKPVASRVPGLISQPKGRITIQIMADVIRRIEDTFRPRAFLGSEPAGARQNLPVGGTSPRPPSVCWNKRGAVGVFRRRSGRLNIPSGLGGRAGGLADLECLAQDRSGPDVLA